MYKENIKFTKNLGVLKENKMNKNDLVSNMFTLKDFLKVTGLKNDDIFTVVQKAMDLDKDGTYTYCAGFHPYWLVKVTLNVILTEDQKQILRNACNVERISPFNAEHNHRQFVEIRVPMFWFSCES